MTKLPPARKELSADALFRNVRESFQDIRDPRTGKSDISLPDALMSGLAVFAFKDPSLLAFDQRRQKDEENLQMIFGMKHVPCDSRLREILDPVDFEQLRPAFRNVFACVARGKALEDMRFLDGYYLLALDGTQYFSSSRIHCSQCLEKHHRDGTITYHHQMLGAALVCPGRKEVIPLMPEPILKQDGEKKNDCERNSLKRFLPNLRQDHPHLPLIATLDALYANAPVIQDLRNALMPWIIRVKPDGNAFLFEQVGQLAQQGLTEDFETTGSDGIYRRYRLAWNVPLNESNPDVRVDFLEVWEAGSQGMEPCCTFILDPVLRLCRQRAEPLMRGGRSRWKIENETFNTLKNQGYHFERNYGHGCQNLSVVLAMLMMLAFLIDQIQQLCCPQFAAAWEKCISKRALWERIRAIFRQFTVRSMQEIYEALLCLRKPPVKILWDS
jgi:hypothetical protein